MTGGLEMLVLEGANARTVAGSGCEFGAGVRCTRFVDGDYSWDLSLGQRTGNEEIGRGCFWWVVDGFSLGPLSVGGGGGEEETPGHILLSRFRRTTRVSKQPFLCYILYIEQWRFRYSMHQTIANGAH